MYQKSNQKSIAEQLKILSVGEATEFDIQRLYTVRNVISNLKHKDKLFYSTRAMGDTIKVIRK